MTNEFLRRLFILCDTENMAEISRITGVPYNTMKNYNSGAALPSAEVLMQIATATGVNINWLLLGEGSMKPSERDDSASDASGRPTTIRIVIPAMQFDIKYNYDDSNMELIPIVRTTPEPIGGHAELPVIHRDVVDKIKGRRPPPKGK